MQLSPSPLPSKLPTTPAIRQTSSARPSIPETPTQSLHLPSQTHIPTPITTTPQPRTPRHQKQSRATPPTTTRNMQLLRQLKLLHRQRFKKNARQTPAHTSKPTTPTKSTNTNAPANTLTNTPTNTTQANTTTTTNTSPYSDTSNYEYDIEAYEHEMQQKLLNRHIQFHTASYNSDTHSNYEYDIEAYEHDIQQKPLDKYTQQTQTHKPPHDAHDATVTDHFKNCTLSPIQIMTPTTIHTTPIQQQRQIHENENENENENDTEHTLLI